MEVAREYVRLSRVKRDLDRQLASTKKEIEALEGTMLELIESEQLPESFRRDGASVFTREQIWASPVGGDHDALSQVLADLGLVEYLPNKVNSHSISAYIREHVNPETGEIEGIDPQLLASLKISKQTKVVVNG